MDLTQLAGVLGLSAMLVLMFAAGAWPAELPEAEQGLKDTVDPWGLAFSDQLARFEAIFADRPEAPFALGLTHDLVKVWPTKYWFRGEATPAGSAAITARELWAAAGETQSFQVVALPRIGVAEATYTLTVDAPGAQVEVYREVFVRTSPGAAYPRFHSDRWPDPLLPEDHVTVSGTDCGVFWVDVRLPAEMKTGTVTCRVALSDGRETAGAVVPIRVVGGLTLDPKAYPFVSWFRRNKLSEEQYRDLCALALGHHVVPVDALRGQWDPTNPAKFDSLREFLAAHGQRMFDVDRPGTRNVDFDSLYAHLREKGWLDNTWVYSNRDEPDAQTFLKENIPFCQMVHERYPGIRVYLASDGQADMAQGCDAWMTDLSASRYDPESQRHVKAPQLWHYYCHLPVRWQMRAPLVQAPNMQIDNPALEHRLAIWMSHCLGARAIFIWAGSAYTFGPDFWKTLALDDKPSGFPYGGVHNGNGWVVYPSPDGKTTVPSLRLKVIRDGLEDVALLEAARRELSSGSISGDRATALMQLLAPVPGVFVSPHYFDQLPETLLTRREAVLKLLSQ